MIDDTVIHTSMGTQRVGAEACRQVFADGVNYLLTPTDDYAVHLTSAEQVATRDMSEQRLRSYSTGRYLSHQLLANAGFPDTDVLSGDEREPLWPPGVQGSISHTDAWCLVAMTTAVRYCGLGVDIEQVQALESGLRDIVLTQQEQRDIAALPALSPLQQTSGNTLSVTGWPAVYFSIKESLFKCRFPVERQWIDFHQATVSVDPDARTFSAVFAPELDNTLLNNSNLNGQFAIIDDHVISVASLVR